MKSIRTIFLVAALFQFSELYSQWVPIGGPNGGIVYSLANKDSVIYAGTATGLFRTDDKGQSWNSSNMTGKTHAIIIEGSTIIAGTAGNGYYGILISSNDGLDWEQTFSAAAVYSFSRRGASIFAGTASGTYLSTNTGQSWSQVSSIPTVLSMTVNDTDIFAGTGSGGIYQSTNNGAAWTQNSLGYFHYIYSLVIKGSAIFAGAGGVIDNGLYVSSNYGISWTQMMPGQYFWALNKSGANIIAGTNGNGVYISSDNGMNWEQYNDGMGNQNIYSLLVTSNFIYAGTSTSIWKRSLSQLVGAGNHSSSIPQSYKLHQNFPNPFNPSTNISYDVRNEGIVRIRIFDALGNEITTLINEKHDPGNYELTWDAGELTSGVYYCKFEVNDFSETRKMALVK